MIIKEYNYLPEEAREIRTKVFVEEQGFEEEFDDIDKVARHFVMYSDEKPIATCRTFFNNDKESFIIGRMAVVKEWRGKSIGAKMLKAAEASIRAEGGKKVMLSGQLQAMEFYVKQGYIKSGHIYLEEGCPHICLKKDL
jgi:predicted GNAT family N-acyltransferase